MPYSLWLQPHEGNPFTKTMQEFISEEVPKQFDQKQNFFPHITVVQDIDIGSKAPQDWLDNLELPPFKNESNEVLLYLDEIQAEDDYYRKMNIAVNEDGNLTKLAAECKRQAGGGSGDAEKAQQWAQNDYHPHLSLLYADLPTKDVANKKALIEMKLQFAIGDIFACCGGTLCMGGYLTLVDTSKPATEWSAAAKRETPWAMWRATKNLI